ILRKVRKGKLHIEIEDKGQERLTRKIEIMTNRIVIAFLIAALLIASSIMMNADIAPGATTSNGIPYLSIVGFSLSGFLGLILLISIWRSGKD
ncbi:MAG: hypothetical protein QQN41_07405, partial [Nitrosopumilus sp.]